MCYRFIENCDLIVYKYAEYGKQFAKENKLSIGKNDNIIWTNRTCFILDAIIQVALQVAYFRSVLEQIEKTLLTYSIDKLVGD